MCPRDSLQGLTGLAPTRGCFWRSPWITLELRNYLVWFIYLHSTTQYNTFIYITQHCNIPQFCGLACPHTNLCTPARFSLIFLYWLRACFGLVSVFIYGRLRLALSDGPNCVGLPCPIHLRTETDPVSETLWSFVKLPHTRRWTESKRSQIILYCFRRLLKLPSRTWLHSAGQFFTSFVTLQTKKCPTSFTGIRNRTMLQVRPEGFWRRNEYITTFCWYVNHCLPSQFSDYEVSENFVRF
jgi:hypothetical protein